MTSPENDSKETDDIQKDILSGRMFSLAEAIGREGGSFLKGESPVPKFVQALTEINEYIKQAMYDPSGILQATLFDWVKADEMRVSRYLNTPLGALREILEVLTGDRDMLYEFVRDVDCKWGQVNGERPHFQTPGQSPHPEDEFTHESVQQQLSALLKTLQSQP